MQYNLFFGTAVLFFLLITFNGNTDFNKFQNMHCVTRLFNNKDYATFVKLHKGIESIYKTEQSVWIVGSVGALR